MDSPDTVQHFSHPQQFELISFSKIQQMLEALTQKYSGSWEDIKKDNETVQMEIEQLLGLKKNTLSALCEKIRWKVFGQIAKLDGYVSERHIDFKKKLVLDADNKTIVESIPDLNSPDIVGFANMHQADYLLYQLIFLVELYVNLSKDFLTKLPLPKMTLIHFLAQEIFLLSNAYRIFSTYLSLVINSAIHQDEIKKNELALHSVATQIIEQFISMCKSQGGSQHNQVSLELIIPCGSRGHAVYLSFIYVYANNSLYICLDNSQTPKQEQAAQREIIGSFTLDAFGENAAQQLIKYIKNICAAKNNQFYNPVKNIISECPFSEKFKQNSFPHLSSQKIENCVVEGYRMGLWYRLQNIYKVREHKAGINSVFQWLYEKSVEFSSNSHPGRGLFEMLWQNDDNFNTNSSHNNSRTKDEKILPHKETALNIDIEKLIAINFSIVKKNNTLRNSEGKKKKIICTILENSYYEKNIKDNTLKSLLKTTNVFSLRELYDRHYTVTASNILNPSLLQAAGKCYDYNSQYELAIEYFYLSLLTLCSIPESNIQEELLIKLLTDLGKALNGLNEFGVAITHLSIANSLYETMNINNISLLIDVLEPLGCAKRGKGKFSGAISLFLRVADYCKDNEIKLVDIYNTIGHTYRNTSAQNNQKNIELSINYHARAEAICNDKSKNKNIPPIYVARTLMGLAVAKSLSVMTKDMQKNILKLHNDALAIKNKIYHDQPDHLSFAQSYHYLGDFYFLIDEYKKSKTNYTKSLKIRLNRYGNTIHLDTLDTLKGLFKLFEYKYKNQPDYISFENFKLFLEMEKFKNISETLIFRAMNTTKITERFPKNRSAEALNLENDVIADITIKLKKPYNTFPRTHKEKGSKFFIDRIQFYNDQIKNFLDYIQAQKDEGHKLYVTGESGCGKTYLILELYKLLHDLKIIESSFYFDLRRDIFTDIEEIFCNFPKNFNIDVSLSDNSIIDYFYSVISTCIKKVLLVFDNVYDLNKFQKNLIPHERYAKSFIIIVISNHADPENIFNLPVSNFNPKEVSSLINNYFEDYIKRLPDEKNKNVFIKKILDFSVTQYNVSPLYLAPVFEFILDKLNENITIEFIFEDLTKIEINTIEKIVCTLENQYKIQHFLDLLSVLNPSRIPKFVIKEYFAAYLYEEYYTTSMRKLFDYKIITESISLNEINIHSIFQGIFFKRFMTKKYADREVERIFRFLIERFDFDPNNPEEALKKIALFPHVKKICCIILKTEKLFHILLDNTDALRMIGNYFYMVENKPEKDIKYCNKALSFYEQKKKLKDMVYFKTLVSISVSYMYLGNYQECIDKCKQVIDELPNTSVQATDEEIQHLILKAHNNIYTTFDKMGHHRYAYNGFCNRLDSNSSYFNTIPFLETHCFYYAMACYHFDKFAEAESNAKRSIDAPHAKIKVIGLIALSQILENDIGRRKESLQIINEAYTLADKKLKFKKHNILGRFCYPQVKWKALASHEADLSFYEKKLEYIKLLYGKFHFETAKYTYYVGLIYGNLNRFAQAKETLTTCYEICQRSLKKGNPNLSLTLTALKKAKTDYLANVAKNEQALKDKAKSIHVKTRYSFWRQTVITVSAVTLTVATVANMMNLRG